LPASSATAKAETGPLATGWHGNKFLNAPHGRRRAAVPTPERLQDREPDRARANPERELVSFLEGCGWRPLIVSGDEPEAVHQALARALDEALNRIAEIQQAAREAGDDSRPQWPMIVLRTPKGWTGPKQVDGLPVEGTWRAHQVPVTSVRENPEHLRVLEDWLRSYRAEELFDDQGTPAAGARRTAAAWTAPDERLTPTPTGVS
jgi:xylulose-5-phosphate/fructose-6-phosphate phosphoketolase